MAKIKRLASRANTKILAHEHTGRIRSHQHTSYGGLVLIILLALVPILFAQHAAVSADDTDGVYAVIRSPQPTTAPQITNVPEGRVFTTNDSFTVSGNCPSDMQVKIFKNGVLAGSTLCKSGSFSLTFDLFIGANALTARAYNAENIAGPESSPINVRLVPKAVSGSSSALASSTSQFFLTSDAYYRGTSSGKTISWLITVSGGQAPYTVNVSWGDGKTETLKQGAAGQFKISHVYDKPASNNGNYTVVLQAKDQQAQNALLQLVAVVPADSTVATAGTSSGGSNGWFTTETAIQTLGTVVLIVLSFWIGERYEFRLLKHQQASAG